MPNEDYILRVTIANGAAVAFVATTAQTVQTAAHIHNTSPVVSAALGRALTAAAIMSAQLKNTDDLLTLTIKGDGAIGGIVATAAQGGAVKGYPFVSNVDLPLNKNGKLDVAAAIGSGSLNVIKDLGLKEPYVGTIKLVSGEIAEDLAYYFTVSEQIPSAVALGVLINRDCSIGYAGGFLLQMLPNATDDVLTALEQKIAALQSVTSFYQQGKTAYDLCEYLFGEVGYEITEKTPVEFKCDCNINKVEKALISVGKEELEKILREDGKANLHCHFCGKDYFFDKARLDKILENI